VQEVVEEFSTHPENGLSEGDISKKREQYGMNVIEEEKKNPILKFLSHFWGPIPWMIEITVILSAIAQRWEDFGVILFKPWPSWMLFVALEGTQVVGTLFAVYGVLIHPIGWAYALSVWGYALVWIIALNAVKVMTYRLAGDKLGA
jgi:magnesium-transporting ATPase (P-type)